MKVEKMCANKYFLKESKRTASHRWKFHQTRRGKKRKRKKKNTTSMIIINSCDLFLYKSDMINNIPPRANFLLWGEIFLLCVQVKVDDRMTPIHFGLFRKCNEWPKYILLWLIWCLVSQVDTSLYCGIQTKLTQIS